MDNKYLVRKTKDVVIDGSKGDYYGKHNKMNRKQEGNGVFDSKQKLVLGRFTNGGLSQHS